MPKEVAGLSAVLLLFTAIMHKWNKANRKLGPEDTEQY